jgi:hypothetical protein
MPKFKSGPSKNKTSILTENNGNSPDSCVSNANSRTGVPFLKEEGHLSLQLRQYRFWCPLTSYPIRTGVLEAERNKRERSWNKTGADWQKRKMKYLDFYYEPKSFILQSCNKSFLREVFLNVIEEYYWRLSSPVVTLCNLVLAYRRFLQACCFLLQDWRVSCESKAARNKKSAQCLLARLPFRSWRRQYVPPIRQWTTTRLYGLTQQKIILHCNM